METVDAAFAVHEHLGRKEFLDALEYRVCQDKILRADAETLDLQWVCHVEVAVCYFGIEGRIDTGVMRTWVATGPHLTFDGDVVYQCLGLN